MGSTGLPSYTVRGTGLTSTGFPKIILEITIALPLELDSQHVAGSMAVALDSCSQIRGVLSPPWVGDTLSQTLPFPRVDLETQWAGPPDRGSGSWQPSLFAQFQRNKATTTRLEPIALDFCVCCESIQKHNQLQKLGESLGGRVIGMNKVTVKFSKTGSPLKDFRH